MPIGTAATMSELVGQANLGLLMAAQQAVFAVGGALGPVLGGLLLGATDPYVPIVLLTAGALLSSAVLMSASGRRGSV